MRSERMRRERRTFLARCLGGAAALMLPVAAGRAGQTDDDPAVDSLERIGSAARSDDERGLWAVVREQFALDPELTYLNNAGLGPSPVRVIHTVARETSALERISEAGHERVAAVRERLCRFLRCDKDELAFTRNTTEGMNIIARGLPLEAGDEVLLTTHEHPGGAMCWLSLAKDRGVRVKLFEPGVGGEDTLARAAAAMTPRTRVLSVSHVTCTHGLRLPVRELTKLCRDKGIVSVVDGAQALGMLPVDLHAIGCDFYAASGHKWLLGPTGTGLLYVRRAMFDMWHPTYVGAYSDREYDLDKGTLAYLPTASSVEAGTHNTPLILGLGAAVDFLDAIGGERIMRRGRALAARVREGLQAHDALEVLTPEDPRSTGAIVTFRLRNGQMDPWVWANRLRKEHRIRVRPVGEHGLNAVRVSTYVYNSFEDVDRFLAAVSGLLKG